MGGLAGGLYDFFDLIGSLFFTFLIGNQRASRPQLQNTRVRMGGFIVFFCICLLVFPQLFLSEREAWFSYDYGKVHSKLFAIVMGLLAAIGAGFFLGTVFLANILIHYVHQIAREAEHEKRREEENRRKQKEKEIKKKKKYAELLEKGISPEEAEYEAEKHATSNQNSGCFIATAVYGNQDAEEVVSLRKWRDDALLKHASGRLVVRKYYEYSPCFVSIIQNNNYIRKVIRYGLDRLVQRIRTSGGC